MEIIIHDKSTLEVITIDSYTGEGTDDIKIEIYNNPCMDLAYIFLNYDEVKKLRDELNEWLDD